MSEAARYPKRLLPVSSGGRGGEGVHFARVPFSCVAVPHEERCQSPVQALRPLAALAAKWAELNRRDTAIPLNTICGRNMRQILRVCDITLH